MLTYAKLAERLSSWRGSSNGLLINRGAIVEVEPGINSLSVHRRFRIVYRAFGSLEVSRCDPSPGVGQWVPTSSNTFRNWVSSGGGFHAATSESWARAPACGTCPGTIGAT